MEREAAAILRAVEFAGARELRDQVPRANAPTRLTVTTAASNPPRVHPGRPEIDATVAVVFTTGPAPATA
jgi:hypothetical protein